MECIEFKDEKKYIKDFLLLPKKIYIKEDNMEDKDTVKEYLLGTHPLSKYFTLYKFLIYDNNEVVGRFIITTYPKDNNCYIGFFECINDKKVSKFLFKKATEFAKKKKYKKMIGPVDASFWNKYRMKINLFDLTPYTGEPYNKYYYLDLWKNSGFKVVEHYTSNIYEVVEDTYNVQKFKDRYEQIINSGVNIYSPKTEEFDNTIEDLYYLITDLYSDFPIYKDLSLKDFKAIFSSYKKIINMDMVKVAYYNSKMVGFFISIPNYNNKVYHLKSIKNIFSILKIKKHPSEYVMLYMGADSNHKGLGSALSSSILEELRKSKLPSIGALARDGKVTQKYASDKIAKQYEYVLLEVDI